MLVPFRAALAWIRRLRESPQYSLDVLPAKMMYVYMCMYACMHIYIYIYIYIYICNSQRDIRNKELRGKQAGLLARSIPYLGLRHCAGQHGEVGRGAVDHLPADPSKRPKTGRWSFEGRGEDRGLHMKIGVFLVGRGGGMGSWRISQFCPSQAGPSSRNTVAMLTSNNSNWCFKVKGKTRIPTNYPSTDYPFWRFGILGITAATKARSMRRQRAMPDAALLV